MKRIDNCRVLLTVGGREWVGSDHGDRGADFVFEAMSLQVQRMKIIFLKTSLEMVQRKITGCRAEKLS